MYIMAKETIAFKVTSIENLQIDKVVIFEGDICEYDKDSQILTKIRIGQKENEKYFVSYEFVEEYFEADLNGFVSLLLKDNNCYECSNSFTVIGIYGDIEDAIEKAGKINKECNYKETFTILLEEIQ